MVRAEGGPAVAERRAELMLSVIGLLVSFLGLVLMTDEFHRADRSFGLWLAFVTIALAGLALVWL